MSKQLKSNQLETSLLRHAVSKMMNEMGKESAEENPNNEKMIPDPKYAAEFEKALDKAYRAGQFRAFGKGALKAGKYAVTFCSILIIILTASVISVDALRFKLIEWLIGVHDSHNSINISGKDKIYNDVMVADYLPEGYSMVSYTKEDDITDIQYSNGQYNIGIRIHSDDYGLTSDNENTSEDRIYINGYEGIYQKKESLSILFWCNGEKIYSINANDPQITKEEIVKIAQSIN